jgi:opacity protein-like surface antigen
MNTPKKLILSLSIAAAAFVSNAQAGEDQGPYARADVGVSIFNGFIGSVTDPGFALSGAVGYQFNRYLGLEGELGVTQNDVTYLGYSVATITTVPVFLNAVATLPVGETFAFQAAAGLGYGSVDLTSPYLSGSYGASGTCAQGKLGVNVNLSKSMTLGAHYTLRYVLEDSTLSQNIVSASVGIKF